MLGQRRPRLQQAVEIDPARQPLRSDRRTGSAPASDRAPAPKASISSGSIASNASRAAAVRSERTLPERQPSIRARAAGGSAKPASRQRRSSAARIVRQPRALARRRACRRSPRPARHAARSRSSSAVAVGEAVQPRDIVERLGLGGQAVGLPVVDHLQPVLDRAQQPIGVAPARPRRRRRSARPRPARPARRASPARAAPARGRHG